MTYPVEEEEKFSRQFERLLKEVEDKERMNRAMRGIISVLESAPERGKNAKVRDNLWVIGAENPSPGFIVHYTFYGKKVMLRSIRWRRER